MEQRRYEFTLPLPPSANRYWRVWDGRVVVSAVARAYRIRAGWLAKAAGCQPLAGPVGVRVAVHRKAQVGNLDNFLKILLDALNGVAYDDDEQVIEIIAHRLDDKAKPRVVVQVWQAGD